MTASASIIGWESVGIFAFQFNASTIFVQTFLTNFKTDPIGYFDHFLSDFNIHSLIAIAALSTVDTGRGTNSWIAISIILSLQVSININAGIKVNALCERSHATCIGNTFRTVESFKLGSKKSKKG